MSEEEKGDNTDDEDVFYDDGEEDEEENEEEAEEEEGGGGGPQEPCEGINRGTIDMMIYSLFMSMLPQKCIGTDVALAHFI